MKKNYLLIVCFACICLLKGQMINVYKSSTTMKTFKNNQSFKKNTKDIEDKRSAELDSLIKEYLKTQNINNKKEVNSENENYTPLEFKEIDSVVKKNLISDTVLNKKVKCLEEKIKTKPKKKAKYQKKINIVQNKCYYKWYKNELLFRNQKYLNVLNFNANKLLATDTLLKQFYVLQDSLKRISDNEKFNRIENKNAICFPTGNSLNTKKYFEGIDTSDNNFFKNNGVFASSNLHNLGFFSEMFRDYFGMIKIGVSIGFNNDSIRTDSLKKRISKEDIKSSMNRIQSSGGNLSIKADLPLLLLRSKRDKITCRTNLTSRLGYDFQATKLQDKKPAFILEPAIESSIFIKGYDNKLSFFVVGKYSRFPMTKNTYLETLGISNKQYFFQFGGGIQILDFITLYYTKMGGKNEIKKLNTGNLQISFTSNI